MYFPTPPHEQDATQGARVCVYACAIVGLEKDVL